VPGRGGRRGARALLGSGDLVTDTADGFDQGGMFAELLAKAFHVGVEGAAMGIVGVLPDGAHQVVAVLWFSGPFAEKEEEFELSGGEVDFLVLDVEGLVVFVEAQFVEGEGGGADGFLAAFEDGFYAEKEFLGAEWFRELVVDAGFETLDAVAGLGPGGEHEDGSFGGAGVAFEFLDDAEAVEAGEHEVED
jgi:hypothetical protein